MKNLILCGLFLMFPYFCFPQVNPKESDYSEDIWKNIRLTTKEAKILTKATSGFPLWIPVSAGTVGVITITYLFLSDNEGKPIMAKANDDQYTVMCGMRNEINPLTNDIGDSLIISSYAGAPIGVTLLSGTTFSVGPDILQSFSFDYTIKDKAGNFSTALIQLEVQTPTFTVNNQRHEMLSGNPLNGNILTGAVCAECIVKNVSVPPGISITWTPDGNFNTSIVNLTEKPIVYDLRFEIIGKCGVTTEAILKIVVLNKNCNISPITEQKRANCDRSDGMITVKDIGVDYNFLWNNGNTSNVLSAIPTGTYTLLITNKILSCSQSFTFKLEENEVTYFKEIKITPGNCYQSGSILVNIDNQTSGPYLITASGPLGNFSFETVSSPLDLAKLIELATGGKPVTGIYDMSIRDKQKAERCTQKITVNIPIEPIVFSLKDDEFKTGQNSPLKGNVLSNDKGTGLFISQVNQLPGATLVMERNGQFTFKGTEGSYLYTYTARDTCGQEGTALLIINVHNIICDYRVDFSTFPSICGDAAGSVIASIFPSEPVTFLWSNGETNTSITGLSAGTYTLTVTHPSGACFQVFSVVVESINFPYLTASIINQESCNTGPEIILNVQGPISGVISINAFGPSGNYQFTVQSGNLLLSNFVALTFGMWTLTINDASAGPECAQQYTFELLPYLPLALTLLDVQRPSSPTALDGIVFVQISGGIPPYSIVGPGMRYANLMPGFNVLQGFPSGIFNLVATDEAGCLSNIIVVEMFGNKPTFKTEVSIVPYLPILLANKAGAEPKRADVPAFILIPMQSLMTTFYLRDNFISFGLGRGEKRLPEITNQSLHLTLNFFNFEIGRQWFVKNFYTSSGLRFQYHNVLTHDKGNVAQNGFYNLNLSFMSGAKFYKNIDFLFRLDWYPKQQQLIFGQTLRYSF